MIPLRVLGEPGGNSRMGEPGRGVVGTREDTRVAERGKGGSYPPLEGIPLRVLGGP